MGKVNRGKDFENQIKIAFEQLPETFVLRLIDPQNGFAGVRNICDFIVYKYPFQLLIECKSCYGNTLSIHTNDPAHSYGAITNNQWDSLYANSNIPGIIAGYMIWFIDHDKTIFITAQDLYRLRLLGNKSINIKTLSDCWYITIPGKKKRILFDYDMTDFMTIEVNKLWAQCY